MNLYTTELRRLYKRRFIRYTALGGLLVLVAVVVSMFLINQKIGPEQWAAAERQAEQEWRLQVEETQRLRTQCEQARAAGNTADHPAGCAEIEAPPREAFKAEWYLPSTFDFRREFEPTLTTLTAVLALVAFLCGASFVGAEWSSGGMTNLLLWRPRRLEVLFTKLAALLSALAGLTVLTAAAWTAAFWAVGTLRGTTEKMTPGVWQSLGLTGLRGLVLVLAAGAVGFGLASLGRHTALALGGVLGVMVVAQFGLGLVLELAGARFVGKWMLHTYLLAWMQKKVTLYDWNACAVSYGGACEPATFDITWQASSVLLAAGLALVVGGAAWAMRRRDIT
jgi:hypothetical protein